MGCLVPVIAYTCTALYTAPSSLSDLGSVGEQIGRSGPFFTAFLAHSWAMGLRIRQKLSSLGPIFAFDAPSPTGC